MNMKSLMLLDVIPFEPDIPALCTLLRIRPGSAQAAEFERLLLEACQMTRPKALYRQAFVEERGSDYVILDGVRFTSRVLAVNLQDTQRAFPALTTCGMELAEWGQAFDDLLYRFWVEGIQEAALTCARQHLERHLADLYQLGPLGEMNPGSLEDWPLPQQQELFSLLGDTGSALGVHLNPDFLMSPVKTVSGIYFPLESGFVSCQLCSREACRNRRAPYDAGLFQERYAAYQGPPAPGASLL